MRSDSLVADPAPAVAAAATLHRDADGGALALELTSALTLIPYLLVAAYALKLASTGESYEKNPGARNKDLIVAGIATFYSALMIYSGGLKYILLSALIFFPTTLIFYKARKDAGQQVFAPALPPRQTAKPRTNMAKPPSTLPMAMIGIFAPAT